MYVDVSYLLPNNSLTPLVKYFGLTHYVDYNLFHEQLTGCLITGVLHLAKTNPVGWYSKKHNIVETATYGSDFVSSRTCVGKTVDLRNNL